MASTWLITHPYRRYLGPVDFTCRKGDLSQMGLLIMHAWKFCKLRNIQRTPICSQCSRKQAKTFNYNKGLGTSASVGQLFSRKMDALHDPDEDEFAQAGMTGYNFFFFFNFLFLCT